MSDLGERARALLDAARDGHEPTPQTRERVRNGLARSLGTGLLGGATLIAAKQAAAALNAASAAPKVVGSSSTLLALWLKIPLALKLVMLATALCAGVLGSYYAFRTNPARDPTSAAIVGAPSLPSDSATPNIDRSSANESLQNPQPLDSNAPTAQSVTPPGSVARVVSRAASASASPVPPASVASATGPGLAEEARGLAEAQMALQKGDPDRALAMIEEQNKRFRQGALQEERAAARLFALCKAKPSAQTQEAARQFLRAYPNSPLVDRVRSECLSKE